MEFTKRLEELYQLDWQMPVGERLALIFQSPEGITGIPAVFEEKPELKETFILERQSNLRGREEVAEEHERRMKKRRHKAKWSAP